MMARGFRPVGWVAALGVAALGCYMLSLRVASERADLARLDSKIIAAQQNIRTLQTEVGTRSRIPQLEDWNEEVLALAAPAAGQFVENNVSLARFDMRAPQLPDPAEVRLASAETAAPAPHQAAPVAAPVQRAVAAPTPTAAPQAQVRRASLEVGAPAPTLASAKTRSEAPRERARPASTPTRTAAGPERRREAAPVRTASSETRDRPATTPTRTASREEGSRLTPGPARTAPREERRRPAVAPAPIRTASAQPPRARPVAATVTRAAAAPARQTRGEHQRGTRD